MAKAKQPKEPPVIKRCSCGAMPPKVGVIKMRRPVASKGVYIGCTSCGRVGEPAKGEPEAIEHWNAGMIKYSGELDNVGGEEQ